MGACCGRQSGGVASTYDPEAVGRGMVGAESSRRNRPMTLIEELDPCKPWKPQVAVIVTDQEESQHKLPWELTEEVLRPRPWTQETENDHYSYYQAEPGMCAPIPPASPINVNGWTGAMTPPGSPPESKGGSSPTSGQRSPTSGDYAPMSRECGSPVSDPCGYIAAAAAARAAGVYLGDTQETTQDLLVEKAAIMMPADPEDLEIEHKDSKGGCWTCY